MPPRCSPRVDSAAGGAAGAVQGPHELHTALQSALQLLQNSIIAQNYNLTALDDTMVRMRKRIMAAAHKAPAERFTPAELDALSALLHTGPPFDVWAIFLVHPCIFTPNPEHAAEVAAGRMQQPVDAADLLTASIRLALDTSRCGHKPQGEVDCMQQIGAEMARWVVSRLAGIGPQRLLRLPGGSALPAAFARTAAAEGDASLA